MKAKFLIGLRICLLACTLIAVWSLISSFHDEQSILNSKGLQSHNVGFLVEELSPNRNAVDARMDDRAKDQEKSEQVSIMDEKVGSFTSFGNLTKYESFRFPPSRIAGNLPTPDKDYHWNHLASHPEATNISFKIPNDPERRRIHYSQLPLSLIHI